MSSSKQYLAVAAIDFGTTYSGWALSFRHEYERDPLKVETRHWHNGENITLKTSSSVLIQPDGKTLEGFGYKAEDRYQEIVDDDPKYHKGYFYFSRFKMVLFREDKTAQENQSEAVQECSNKHISIPENVNTQGKETNPTQCGDMVSYVIKQKQIFKRWSDEEIAALKRQFVKHLLTLKPPMKTECLKAIANEPVLANRSWKDVKFRVWHIIKKTNRTVYQWTGLLIV